MNKLWALANSVMKAQIPKTSGYYFDGRVNIRISRAQIRQNSWSHFKILGVGRVT